jgi:LysM repeat protein
VYSGPQFPREMVGYGARRDPTDPRGIRSGVRLAKPASKWELADGLPTVPTVLIAGAAVVLAFIIGSATGGGGGSSVAATSQTSATVVATTTTIPATHTVVLGDSLSSIAATYGLTTQELASFNNISNLNHVFTGEVIKIPPSTAPTTVPATPTTKKK